MKNKAAVTLGALGGNAGASFELLYYFRCTDNRGGREVYVFDAETNKRIGGHSIFGDLEADARTMFAAEGIAREEALRRQHNLRSATKQAWKYRLVRVFGPVKREVQTK